MKEFKKQTPGNCNKQKLDKKTNWRAKTKI